MYEQVFQESLWELRFRLLAFLLFVESTPIRSLNNRPRIHVSGSRQWFRNVATHPPACAILVILALL